jgi:cytidine deaminase
MIPASKVTEMLAAAGLDSAEELLPKLLADARSMALPTISGFLVGAAALGESGAIYLGANLEFPAQQLNQSVHAEQFAIVNAARNGELRIVRICVNETPCGHCRQFMQVGTLHFLSLVN